MSLHKEEIKSLLVSRQRLGQRTGAMGLAVNAILFITKLALGIITNSVSILADSFNNLTDCASSLVTILGFKLSNKDKDDKHPYGYGRMEYISGFLVSFLIIGTAFSLGKTAIVRIMHPQPLRGSSLFFLILVLSIAMKLALACYIQFVNRTIRSATLRATFKDSLADAVVTAITLIAFLLAPTTALPLDGITGLIVAVIILWSGITSFRENLDLLLGMGASNDLSERVIRTVLKYDAFDKVEAFHVYDFGPETQTAFLQVSLKFSPHLNKVQTAIKEVSAEIKQQFDLDVTIYWNANHIESVEGGEGYENDPIQRKLSENHSTH